MTNQPEETTVVGPGTAGVGSSPLPPDPLGASGADPEQVTIGAASTDGPLTGTGKRDADEATAGARDSGIRQ